jgi:hypothetical protein
MLHIFLALDRGLNIFVPFNVDKALKPIFPREAVRESLAVFPYPAR